MRKPQRANAEAFNFSPDSDGKSLKGMATKECIARSSSSTQTITQ